MIQVMDLRSVLWRLTLSAIVLSLLVYYFVVRFFFADWPVYKIVTITSSVASAVIGLFFSNKVWRPLWGLAVRLDNSRYPDLNGIWEGTVQPSSLKEGASVAALPIKARIRLSMTEMFIDFHGKTFKSVTLAATPRVEQGQHYLYYIYRAEPQDPNRQSYVGIASLRVQITSSQDDSKNPCLLLSGNYFTDRETRGTISLKQKDRNPDQDVSYY
ncbi:Cap15 family cyclic dinucleotide receptor domain-containing protein [Archangium violaceum]|uniref:Cap15 family cyclic dinucleotide receptor domain-containing protein n=1 Tax=Archangium violaceum TaxID=83451 RepID=UPI0036DAA242